MNRILILICLIISSLTVLYSCSKSDSSNNTPVTPTVNPDTLTTGWSKISIAGTSSDIRLNDVFFSNASTGYTLGDSTCYKSTNGGVSWSKLTPLINYGTNLAVTNDGKLFIVSSNTIYRSSDAGVSFSNIANGPGAFSDIFFIDNNNGYTVTSTGLQQSTDAGVTWPLVYPVTGLTISHGYKTCFFLNSTTGWIGTGIDIYKTNGNINSWTKSSFIGMSPTAASLSIFAISSTVVYAGCSDGNVFKSIDGGTSFSLLASFPAYGDKNYLDLCFIDANTGYACYSNRIYKTSDGGNTWLKVVALGNSFFVEIHFIDANNGWGCTTKGEILRFHK
jgi:photosystem II stability/assembly factor-like uncharacterized protein